MTTREETVEEVEVVADVQPADTPPVEEPTAEALAPTFGENAPLNQGVVEVGGVTLPSGLSLTIVQDPAGSDANRLFFLTGQAFGVNFSFEVGDTEAFKDLFGSDFQEALGLFGNIERVSQVNFDNEFVSMGGVDEIIGSTESLAAVLERDLRALGLESLPEWMRNSPRALTVQAIGSREGWSANRIANELAKTPAFKQRFGRSFETVAAALGTDDVLSVTNQIATMEAALRASIREFRGEEANTNVRFLQNIIGSGWSVGEVDSLLGAERELRNSPGALRNLNQIRAHLGQEAVTFGQMAQFMAGTAAPEVFESIRDALRQSALSAQGVEISTALAASLGEGEGVGIDSPGALEATAQSVARNILDFELELEAGKFGLTREDILKAAFNEERTAEVNQTLQKFARERATAAQGFGAAQGFIDSEGALRIQGLEGL